MRNLVRHALYATVFTGSLLGGDNLALGATGISTGVGTEYVTWREYDGSHQLLEESGLRAFAELGLSANMSRYVDLRARGRIYGGDIHYDGQYQDGTPVTTTTEYRGVTGEMGVAYKSESRDEEGLAFILNVGADRWNRTITGAGGYQEQYQLIFLRTGVEQDAAKGDWGARGGILFPLNTREDVKLLDGVTLEPKGKPSFYFGLGYRFYSGVECRFDYQGYRLDPSGAKMLSSGGVPAAPVYQPQSVFDTFGLSLHWRI